MVGRDLNALHIAVAASTSELVDIEKYLLCAARGAADSGLAAMDLVGFASYSPRIVKPFSVWVRHLRICLFGMRNKLVVNLRLQLAKVLCFLIKIRIFAVEMS